jgi:phosphoglycerol transferase MdoB-like AlkP superfamily enzyme
MVGIYLLKKSPIVGGLNKNAFKICVSILFSLPILLATQPFMGLKIAEIILNAFVAFVLACCSLYCLYCISKSLTTLEFNRSSGFSTYAGTLIILSILPLGIFLIQPRVQRLSNTQAT